MQRDELVKALEAQPHDTDVQIDLGGFLLDVVRVDYDEARVSIVLSALAEDLEDVIFHVLQRPWWRDRIDSVGHVTAAEAEGTGCSEDDRDHHQRDERGGRQ